MSSSWGDIRLIEDDISPRSALKSRDNNSPHLVFKPNEISYSFDEIPSTQEISPRSASKSKENNSPHPAFIAEEFSYSFKETPSTQGK